jgi:hypothetical protein
MAVIAYFLPDSVAGWAWIFAIVLAWNIREAVLHPIFLTMVALTFHRHVYQQPINEQYASVLSSASSKFEELLGRAKSWVSEGPRHTVPANE